jgi:hypothetical protein
MEIIIYKYALQFFCMSSLMLFVGGMQLRWTKFYWQYNSPWVRTYNLLSAFICLCFTVFFGYIAYRWQFDNTVFTDKPHWRIVHTEQELDDLARTFVIAALIVFVIIAAAVKFSRR